MRRRPVESDVGREVVAMVAAFVVYFSVYGFRKPFTAARFDGVAVGGLGYKELLVLAQVIGYTASKFIGIGVVGGMRSEKRAGALLTLVALAEAGLVLLAILPRPWSVLGLLLDGLCLGMTFGLVFGFLEGRRSTEALAAGLCTSFIVADGVMKSVGAWLLGRGIEEDWMPATAGALFAVPLLAGVAVLATIPAPTSADVASRSRRTHLDATARRALYRRWAGGLNAVVAMYVVVTVLRSVRADFAPQLWSGLGVDAPPRLYTQTEIAVATAVTALNGLAVLVHDNRRALAFSLAICAAGAGLLAVTLVARAAGIVGPVGFMVLVGMATYLPYVAIHTTIFERFIAATGSAGNAAFLLYVADALGYSGYALVLCLRLSGADGAGSVAFFTFLAWLSVAAVAMLSILAWASLPRGGDSTSTRPEAAR